MKPEEFQEAYIAIRHNRPIARLFDRRVFEYSYEQYYGLSGQYNPKTLSTGVVFHLP